MEPLYLKVRIGSLIDAMADVALAKCGDAADEKFSAMDRKWIERSRSAGQKRRRHRERMERAAQQSKLTEQE